MIFSTHNTVKGEGTPNLQQVTASTILFCILHEKPEQLKYAQMMPTYLRTKTSNTHMLQLKVYKT